jgi:hypothetical protein
VSWNILVIFILRTYVRMNVGMKSQRNKQRVPRVLVNMAYSVVADAIEKSLASLEEFDKSIRTTKIDTPQILAVKL